nr:hypothetical protein [Armatimonadota bacterium]
HLWWDGDTWSQWENLGGHITSSPTAISTAPNRLDVLAPGIDGNIHWRLWDGSAWQGAFGSPFSPLENGIALPSRYRFSVDFVTVDTARSLNTDTDTAMATLAVGNWPALTATQSMGDVGGTHPKQAQTNLLNFTPITVELCEAAAFNYLIVNNGNADQKSLDDALVKAGTSLTDDAVKSVSQDLGAGAGAITGIEVGGVVAPVIGSLLGALVGWLLGELGGVVFADCDGIVAAEQVVLLGRDLQQHLGKYTHVVTIHPGTDSNTGCGANSKYEVTWSITRA